MSSWHGEHLSIGATFSLTFMCMCDVRIAVIDSQKGDQMVEEINASGMY
jgi:hypothetical protein